MKHRKFLSSDNPIDILRQVEEILSEEPAVETGNLRHVVKKFLKRRESFLNLANKYSTPFYLLDLQELKSSIENFTISFKTFVPKNKVYYAMKTNHHPVILQTIVANGFGLDVSSVREFNLGRDAGCTDMIFTGPGKTIDDLLFVLQKDKNIIIQVDSFGELKRLAKVAKKLNQKIKAGIRIYTKQHGKWNKFGIPLQELKAFWQGAKQYPLIDLRGIQFHLSWNESAKPYQNVIKELAKYLKTNFTQVELNEIKFIDFGGGFRPFQSEGTYPRLIPQGSIIKTANDYKGKTTKFFDKYLISSSITINDFAREIGKAIRMYLDPLVSCEYYTEPGRIISNNAMHIVLKAVDKKTNNNVIMNGGINMIGYERFEYDYFPLINLSQPSLTEHSCTIYGNLCMPDDLWGYYYYGENINEGDILLVPYQGCLTYSLAQNFIQPIPPVYILK